MKEYKNKLDTSWTTGTGNGWDLADKVPAHFSFPGTLWWHTVLLKYIQRYTVGPKNYQFFKNFLMTQRIIYVPYICFPFFPASLPFSHNFAALRLHLLIKYKNLSFCLKLYFPETSQATLFLGSGHPQMGLSLSFPRLCSSLLELQRSVIIPAHFFVTKQFSFLSFSVEPNWDYALKLSFCLPYLPINLCLKENRKLNSLVRFSFPFWLNVQIFEVHQ